MRAYLPNTPLTGLSPVLSCATMVTSAFQQGHSRSWSQLFSTGGRSARLSWFYDLAELNERIRLYNSPIFGVFLVSMPLAFLHWNRLRTVIAKPVARLVRATTTMSQTGDYWDFLSTGSMKC